MPCTPVDLPGLGRAIVCTRGRRMRCACGKAASLQCDAPTRRRSGTCDRRLCRSCATEIGPDRHLCPAHEHARQQAERRRRNEPGPNEPWQAGLF